MESLDQSAFHVGRRCPRRLWFASHEGSRRTGHPAAVGKREEVLAAAMALLPEASPATAEWQGLSVRIDLLQPEEGGHRLIKVLAGTKPRGRHWEDLALQVRVAQGAGIALTRAGVLLLNRKHRMGQEGPELFKWIERETRCDPLPLRDGLLAMCAADAPPAAERGPPCRVPRRCPWWSRCHPEEGPTDIARIPGCAALAERLAAQGVTQVSELPPDLRLSVLQQRAVRCLLSGQDEVVEGLAERLPPIEGVHYLDFEAWNPALPRFPGTSPYATLPVQWSLHSASGEHAEWLHREHTDPRAPFLSSLQQAVSTLEGPILTWSPFEERMLRSLGDTVVAPRIVDLQAIVMRLYYHPGFGPAFSLKRVLSVLCPGEGYTDLDIQDGGTATVLYQRMLEGDSALARSLLDYCERDTWALMRVHQALAQRCEDKLAGC